MIFFRHSRHKISREVRLKKAEVRLDQKLTSRWEEGDLSLLPKTLVKLKSRVLCRPPS